jgi:sterol 3beta-glucosyltransferase
MPLQIAIPYSAILDVEKSTAMDFSETIEVKVFDKEEHFSVDSYFFAYFHDIPAALDQIRDAVRAYRLLPERGSPQMVLDTTVARHLITPDRAASAPAEPTKAISGFSLTSLLRPLQETLSRTTAQNSPDNDSRPSAQPMSNGSLDAEEFTHISRRADSSFIPVTSSPQQLSPEEDVSKSLTPTPAAYDHTYPPSTSNSSVDPDYHSLSREGSSWSVGVPSWLKGTRRVFGASTGSEQTLTQDSSAVREMYSSTTMSSLPSSRSTMGDMVFSVLETPEITVDADATEKFRAAFAYDEKETLLGCTSVLLFPANFSFFFISDFPGYLFRLLPVHGRLYISTNYFCFKSGGPLIARTRVCCSYISSLKINSCMSTDDIANS